MKLDYAAATLEKGRRRKVVEIIALCFAQTGQGAHQWRPHLVVAINSATAFLVCASMASMTAQAVQIREQTMDDVAA